MKPTIATYGERLAVLDDGATDPELPGTVYASIGRLLVDGLSVETLFASRHVGEVKYRRNRIDEDDYEEGETQAQRIISALNRTESEWLPGYAETLRCFLPYVD
ncbi:MAG: hypothetical protein ACREXR_13270, partial [Gammaproteobacteria bacterium]